MEKAQVNKAPDKQMSPIRAGDHTRQQSLLGRDALEELQALRGGGGTFIKPSRAAAGLSPKLLKLKGYFCLKELANRAMVWW